MHPDVEKAQRCHLCGRPLVGGICPACDTPGRRTRLGASGWMRLHDGRLMVSLTVVAVAAVGAALFVGLRHDGGVVPVQASSARSQVSTPPAVQPASVRPSVSAFVFGVSGDVTDEFGGRPVRGLAFAVRSGQGVTDLLTDYYLVADQYLQGNRNLFLQQGEASYAAEIVAVSPDPHVALLRIRAKVDPLPISWVQVKPGDMVTVGALTTSATRQAAVVAYSGPGSAAHLTFSVEVSSAGAGGPVLDAHGKVIGIAEPTSQFGAGARGIGFAIPVASACAAVAAC